jgi:hypothetical protein
LTFLTQRTGDLTCEVCTERTTQLYPLTRYDGKHFVPVKVCLVCLGPASDETFGSLNLPRRVILAGPDDES